MAMSRIAAIGVPKCVLTIEIDLGDRHFAEIACSGRVRLLTAESHESVVLMPPAHVMSDE
jgi:hypothetical protein